ncbi:hypothetical protein EVAR_65408_1 [Eumeta japonica]|uniref:Uncharacterized protein n=1 Tax=Eumeta variegata TaxID=151549 RepID=A0A4C1ZU81_EUMVA|nr:hypothetical protein EVAR_65408_1 [Eumeta japonica]
MCYGVYRHLIQQILYKRKDMMINLSALMKVLRSPCRPPFKRLAVKAPNQDLCYLKKLKDYETVDKLISEAVLSKFSRHFWYLSEEITVLSLFDDVINKETKGKIVMNLQSESLDDTGKRYIPSKEDMSNYLYVQPCEANARNRALPSIRRAQHQRPHEQGSAATRFTAGPAKNFSRYQVFSYIACVCGSRTPRVTCLYYVT